MSRGCNNSTAGEHASSVHHYVPAIGRNMCLLAVGNISTIASKSSRAVLVVLGKRQRWKLPACCGSVILLNMSRM